MPVVHSEEFDDWEGHKLKQVLDTGVEVIYLLEPSERYIHQVLKDMQKDAEKAQKRQEQEALVYGRMRRRAIEELIAEGVLPPDYV